MNKTRSSLMPRSPRFTSPKALALSLSAVLSLALLVALALTSLAAPAAGAGAAANGAPAKIVISKVTVDGKKVTVAGQVTLPVDTAAQRQKTHVALTLVENSGKTEQLSTGIDAKRRFKATKSTKLIGRLTVVALVRIGGKPSGQQARKRFAGPLSATKTGGSGTAGAGAAPPIPAGAQPLRGLFKLDAGKQPVSGVLSGTYFRMLGIFNTSSTALNQEYTLLRPGADGGLRTDGYQEPPTPAFTGVGTGGALANRIVQPQAFIGIDFSIVTAAADPQTGEPDPLAQVYAVDGKVSGQITYWNAQWNGLSFNQGSPKPNGKYVGSTTPLSGTFDAASHFVLIWRSFIEGGPFNGQTGEWHLEGTFVPAA